MGKGKALITVGIVSIVLVALLIGFVAIAVFLPQSPFNFFSIFSDPEAQARLEYNTYWGDITDGSLTSDKFILTGGGHNIDGDSITITAGFGRPPGSGKITLTQKFKGQEVVTLVQNCAPDGERVRSITKYIPHTFDINIYDEIRNGVKIKEIDVGDSGLELSFSCSGSTTFSDPTRMLIIEYIGFKARQCDIRANEVWVQEKFSSKVNIVDLKYNPAQFCATARPFTFITLGEGEEAIFPNPIPAFNRGETIPSRALTGEEIIVINYAVPIDQCQSSGCKQCGLGESNIFENGAWHCENFLREDEPRTITQRIITIPKTRNVFTFTSSEEKTFFNIGDKTFNSVNIWNCNSLEDGIYNPPNPMSSCYTARYSYDGITKLIDDEQEVIIDNLIRFQYISDGSYVNRATSPDDNNLNGVHIFEIGIPLSLEFLDIDKDKRVVRFILTNNLPSNTITVKTQQKALRAEINLPEIKQDIFAKKGDTIIEVPFNIENSGLNEVTINTFYPIDADANVLLSGTGFVFGFDSIIEEGKTTIVIKDVEPLIDEPNIIVQIWNRFIAWIQSIFS